MIVRYTRQALNDLNETAAYIARDNPAAARAVVSRIRTAIASLRRFPKRGRQGQLDGTRELLIADTPFFAAYRITGQHVDIIAIMHGARAWPPAARGSADIDDEDC